MFQFGADEQPLDGLAAALLGNNHPQGLQGVGLGATLSQQAQSPDIANAGPGGSTNGQGGNADGDPDTSKSGPTAEPTDDSVSGEWGKMLAQLYEAGKLRSGYLGKIFGSVDYANLAEGAANTSISVGLGDIQNFEQTGDHYISQQGSLINWRLVDWSKYGADKQLPPETVMKNFLSSAMNSGS
jgi:hypothetical protein